MVESSDNPKGRAVKPKFKARTAELFSGCKRSKRLEAKFEEAFNHKYFGMRHPKVNVLLCTKTKNFASGAMGECLPRRGGIFILEGLSDADEDSTLLHEMVHLTADNHGPRFKREIARLHALGAPVSSWELDLVEDYSPPRISAKNVRMIVQDILIDDRGGILLKPENERLIESIIEQEFVLPISKLKKAVALERIIKEECEDRIETRALRQRLKPN